jgi:predicted MFS family arabinose efflux permease
MLFNGSRVVGPSLAGLTIATIGVAGCFWLNAVSFLAVIGSLLALHPSQFFAQPRRQRASTRQLLAGGLAYSIRTPEVFVLLLILLFLGTFCYNFGTFLPLIAQFTLRTGALGYGFLFSALGIGSVSGAVNLAYLRVHSMRVVFASSAVFVFLLAMLGLSHILPLSLGLLLVIGFFSLTYSTATQTRLQIIVPNELRGRVMSLYTLLFQGSTPIGAMFIGSIAQRWSVEAAIESSAVLSAAGIALASLYQRRQNRAAQLLEAAPVVVPAGEGGEGE